MKLSEFIMLNMESILQEWENFAKTILNYGEKVNVTSLRDHAKGMLLNIVKDLNTPQSKAEQVKKSQGLSLRKNKDITPAEEHGYARMKEGFEIKDVISEFRALRASVIKLATDPSRKIPLSDPYDMVRFNESIDQALAESMVIYISFKESQVWHNANYDLLTGLTNRLMFNHKLEQALKDSKRSGKSIALLFLDLDKFKEINDTLGHAEGDCLLKQAAERMKGCIRETDTASRIGGDEFTVILNNVQDVEKVKIIVEKILSALRKPFQLTGDIVQITVSIGITISPQDGSTAEVLLKNADQAMYVSKNSGRDKCSFWSLDC